MNDVEYQSVATFEDIAGLASAAIPVDSWRMNYILAVSLDRAVLRNGGISDVTDEAKAWQASERPSTLHINHGEYIGDGVFHIIKELKNKPTSNRALYSLIDQGQISNSGDRPIPSFLLLQCAIEDRVLHCAVYFRALEVSTFLRINLEEIRLVLEQIERELMNVSEVHLVLHAFRAYNTPGMSPLRKPEIDTLPADRLLLKHQISPSSFSEMLREKAADRSVISSESLRVLLRHVEDSEISATLARCPNIPNLRAQLNKAVSVADDLAELRRKHSHHQTVQERTVEYQALLLGLSEEYAKCR